MSDVAVVTANFGGYDEPRGAVLQEGYEDADWYAFTPDLEQATDYPDPWEGIGAVNVPEGPRLAAKRYKLTPWRVLEHLLDGRHNDYRWIVWLDSNMEVTDPRFLAEALASAACTGAPLTAMAHPRRTTAADEVVGSWTEAPSKYARMKEALEAQYGEYLAAGFPDDLGLWACGTLIWNMRESRAGNGMPGPAMLLGSAWLQECEKHTIQDQVSLPYTAWRLGMEVGTFPVPQLERRADGAFGNRWIRIWPHNRED